MGMGVGVWVTERLWVFASIGCQLRQKSIEDTTKQFSAQELQMRACAFTWLGVVGVVSLWQPCPHERQPCPHHVHHYSKM